MLNKYEFFRSDINYLDISDLRGLFIVIEGTDGVGRSTQIENIKDWLEYNGYAVFTTGLGRSTVVRDAINEAKKGHNLNNFTFSMLYAADIADRMENDIIPYLKSGYVVIADRYIFTCMARALVRGVDKEWIKKLYSFALKPIVTLYMKVDFNNLIPRVINADNLVENYWELGLGSGLDYWEAGMDIKMGEDFFESFEKYQKKLIKEFNSMVNEYNFIEIDARKSLKDTFKQMKLEIKKVLERWEF
ncbi:MAG: dTMP kinase [Spirochaetes bacterium]|nr:dTMP kinase [Spirochaetota bacterium]